jgi:hypothetical protein
VDDEVDRQEAGLGVPLAHRVGADLRSLVLRRTLARELELHVVVGELAELEARQAVPAEDDPGEDRGQRLDRFDPAGEQRSVAGFGGRRGGDG